MWEIFQFYFHSLKTFVEGPYQVHILLRVQIFNYGEKRRNNMQSARWRPERMRGDGSREDRGE